MGYGVWTRDDTVTAITVDFNSLGSGVRFGYFGNSTANKPTGASDGSYVQWETVSGGFTTIRQIAQFGTSRTYRIKISVSAWGSWQTIGTGIVSRTITNANTDLVNRVEPRFMLIGSTYGPQVLDSDRSDLDDTYGLVIDYPASGNVTHQKVLSCFYGCRVWTRTKVTDVIVNQAVSFLYNTKQTGISSLNENIHNSERNVNVKLG